MKLLIFAFSCCALSAMDRQAAHDKALEMQASTWQMRKSLEDHHYLLKHNSASIDHEKKELLKHDGKKINNILDEVILLCDRIKATCHANCASQSKSTELYQLVSRTEAYLNVAQQQLQNYQITFNGTRAAE